MGAYGCLSLYSTGGRLDSQEVQASQWYSLESSILMIMVIAACEKKYQARENVAIELKNLSTDTCHCTNNSQGQ